MDSQVKQVRDEANRQMRILERYMQSCGDSGQSVSMAAFEHIRDFCDALLKEREAREKDLAAELSAFFDKVGKPYHFSSEHEQEEYCAEVARHFSEWQRESLLSEALYGNVDFCGRSAWVELPSGELTEFLRSHFKEGDDVQVIIRKNG